MIVNKNNSSDHLTNICTWLASRLDGALEDDNNFKFLLHHCLAVHLNLQREEKWERTRKRERQRKNIRKWVIRSVLVITTVVTVAATIGQHDDYSFAGSVWVRFRLWVFVCVYDHQWSTWLPWGWTTHVSWKWPLKTMCPLINQPVPSVLKWLSPMAY